MRAAIQRRQRIPWQGVAPQAAAIAKPQSTGITAIDHFPVREPVSNNQYSLIRVQTRGGLSGWGECGSLTPADLAAVRKQWLGRPATQYATIDAASPGAGALDIALLDIVGQACKAPIYRVLGGPTRNKVRAYSSPVSGAFPVIAVAAPAPAARNQGKAYQNLVRAAMEQVPAEGDFILLAEGRLTPGDAASVAATAQPKHPLWFDEPCSVSNLDAIRKISGETVVPVGFGRGIRAMATFQALLREGLVDVVRPELEYFGITGSRRVAALAETYYVAVAPRHNGGPVATAAALQLAASIPNFFIQHVPTPSAPEDRAMRAALCSPNPESGQGAFLSLTTAPGLGITVHESALERYRAA